MNYEQSTQVFTVDAGKTIRGCEILNHHQLVVYLTDGTHFTVTARLNEGKPWVALQRRTGSIVKEWREEKLAE